MSGPGAEYKPMAQTALDASTGVVGTAAALGGWLNIINGVLAAIVAIVTIGVLVYRFKINRREWKSGR